MELKVMRFETSGNCPYCGKAQKYGLLDILGRNTWIKIKCDCEGEKNSEKNIQEIKKKKRAVEYFEKWNLVGLRFKNKTFENFNSDSDLKNKTLYLCKEYCKNFQKHLKNGTGLYLEGASGTGKTHLSVAIMKELMKNNYSVIFINVSDLLTRLKESQKFGGESIGEVLNDLKKADLLILDDIGSMPSSTTNEDLIYKVVNLRYEAMKPVILTTNASPKALYATLTPKTYDRIKATCIYSNLLNNEKSFRIKADAMFC